MRPAPPTYAYLRTLPDGRLLTVEVLSACAASVAIGSRELIDGKRSQGWQGSTSR